MFTNALIPLAAAVGTYVAVVLSAMAAAGLLALGISFLKTWVMTRRWVKVKARVISWNWEELTDAGQKKFILKRVYEYTVDGQTHRGSGGDDLSLEHEEPQAKKGASKPPGEELDAFYDPKNPDQAVLERNAVGCGWMLIVLATCFLGLAAYCVYEGLPPDPPPPPPLPAEAPERFSGRPR
ncbi:MAG: DUF3592 domain-containing protein [Planctomycetes bacterium]|nr:DUF3592 domain-containing protein [Planctomycetota bacterium]